MVDGFPYTISMRGKGRQGQLGTSVNVVFTLTHLDVRIEMPGYEPYELKNVVPGTEGQARFRVTLVEAETES